MNIEGLKLFKEVAARGTISRAAETSHYSQPAINCSAGSYLENCSFFECILACRFIDKGRKKKMVLVYQLSDGY